MASGSPRPLADGGNLCELSFTAVGPPSTHIAGGPRQVWCWDMTYLPALVMGMWFHLYLILDLYSRKIVGWEVHDIDHSDLTMPLIWCDAPRWPRALPASMSNRYCMVTTALR